MEKRKRFVARFCTSLLAALPMLDLSTGSACASTFVTTRLGVWPVAWLCEALPSPAQASMPGSTAATAPPAAERSAGDDHRSQLQEQRSHLWRLACRHDVLAPGLNCGLHCVERLMQENGLRARPRRRGLPKDTGELPPSPTHPQSRFRGGGSLTRSGSTASPTSGSPKAGFTLPL